MTTAELLVIFLVALIVFGPSKLPMLAEHLAKLVKMAGKLKGQAATFWQNQLNEQRLKENQKKAESADEKYRSK